MWPVGDKRIQIDDTLSIRHANGHLHYALPALGNCIAMSNDFFVRLKFGKLIGPSEFPASRPERIKRLDSTPVTDPNLLKKVI
jgi:hypothetical protein